MVHFYALPMTISINLRVPTEKSSALDGAPPSYTSTVDSHQWLYHTYTVAQDIPLFSQRQICATAHYWGPLLTSAGGEVKMRLPRGNKID